MKTSQTSKPQQPEKKRQAPALSKKNLLELIQTKKSKSARAYIEELRNTNPKAQKIIKDVLDQIFCQKKVTSATLYMYALIFYKNLLISGELDYYEDNQFFPHQIHTAVAKICEYNSKQSSLKTKGADYFKNCVKVEPNEKFKEDLEAMGNAVIIYAMELLQSMADWYPEDYFSGEQSRFLKAYNSYLNKGIVFPKKTDYVYIKEQDQTEFQENYQALFDENEEEKPSKEQADKSKIQKPAQNKNPLQESDDSKLLEIAKLESKVAKQSPQKQPLLKQPPELKNPKQNLTEPKTMSTSVNQNDKKSPLTGNQPQTLLSKVQEKKVTETQNVQKTTTQNVEDLLKKVQLPEKVPGKKTQVQPKEKPAQKIEVKKQVSKEKVQQTSKQKVQPKQKSEDKNFKDNKSFDFPEQANQKSKVVKKQAQQPREPLVQNNKQTESEKTQTKPNDKKDEILKKLAQSRVDLVKKGEPQQATGSANRKQEQLQINVTEAEKKQNSRIQTNPSPKRNIKRTEEAVQKGAQLQFPPENTQQNYFIKADYKTNPRASISQKRKHRIFEQIPQRNQSSFKLSTQRPITLGNQTSIFNQLSTTAKVNVFNSNMSFSPNYLTETKFNTGHIQKKKSVPKTQKQYLEKTFSENEDLLVKFGITQNFFNIGQNRTSTQKVHMKTLSAWRCQKQIKREHSPQNKLNYQSLKEILRKIKFKEQYLPFIPEYFEPVTLKMFGLRKSSLQVSGFTQTSQVFFNNKIIEARLMKPARGSYVLSILNVSRHPLQISPVQMKKIPYSNQIRIASHGNSQDLTILNSGCYFDIHFSFQTSDLNFKFLPFNILVDQNILPLQLPITLLDQCYVQRGIDADNILSYSKKYVKILNSEPFRMNPLEVPNFMKTKFEVTDRTKRVTSRDDEDFWSFTLMFKSENYESPLLLSCCISPHKASIDTWRLEIILDSGSQDTESFAKVMIELLTFLLWE